MRCGLTIKQMVMAVFTIFFITGCSSDIQKKEKLLAQADRSFNGQEYAKAKIHLKNALKIDPRYADAYHLLAETHLKLNEHQDVFKVYSKLESIEPDNPETRLRLAAIYVFGNRLNEARERVDMVLEKNPGHIEALYLRASILLREKNGLEPVKQIYQSIITLDPEQINAYIGLSRVQMELKEYDGAKAGIETAILKKPDSIDLHKALYQFHLTQNNLTAAGNVLESLAEKQPGHPEPFIMLGDFYFRQKKISEAQNAFLNAVENDPGNINTHMLIARFFYATGDIQTAEEYIQKALDIDPDNIDTQYAYADFHFTGKAIDKAETLTDRILETRPGHMPAKILKGKILATNKQFAQAVDWFNTLLTDEPESPLLNYLLASSLMGKGDIQPAKAAFIRALEANPRLHKARLLLGNIYFGERDYALARTEAEKILNDFPGDYDANILMGNILMAQQEYDSAKTIFHDMMVQAPDHPGAYYRAGLLHRILKEDETAIGYFEKALAINPDLMDVFTGLIGIYASQKQYDAGLEKCQAHLELIRDEPVITAIIINLKGDLYLSAQNFTAAETEYLKAIELNPEFVTPYMSLSRLLTVQKKTDDTIGIYQALIERRPDLPAAHSLLGILYETRKQYDLAETHYKKSLDINGDFIPALNNLAYLYSRQDRELNMALDLARRAKEKAGEHPAVMDTLGWVYVKKGLYDSAIIEFNACIEKDPDNPMFHYHLGMAYYKKGQPDNAKMSLEKALELSLNGEDAETARKIMATL